MSGENGDLALVQERSDQRIANELTNDKTRSCSFIRFEFVDRAPGIKPPLDNPPKICYNVTLVTLGLSCGVCNKGGGI